MFLCIYGWVLGKVKVKDKWIESFNCLCFWGIFLGDENKKVI